MNQEKQAFLDALEDNEDDNVLRLIYSDWLEEHDEPEEADRMRKWKAAKEWMIEFTRRINNWEYDEETYTRIGTTGKLNDPHTYQDMIEAGNIMRSGDQYCFGTDEGPEVFREEKEEFFKNWSIITGIHVEEEEIENVSFRCAC